MERLNYTEFERVARSKLQHLKTEVRRLVHYLTTKSCYAWRRHVSVSENENYERLEFLGDALINWLAARFLYAKGVALDNMSGEGSLTFYRRRLVDEKGLAYFARITSLEKYIEIAPNVHKNLSILADVTEAFAAQIWLEFGEKKVEELFYGYWDLLLEFIPKDGVVDPKSQLNKYVQAERLRAEYVFEVTSQRTFSCKLVVGGIPISVGTDYTKKEAAQNAAYIACKLLGI